MKKGGYMAKPSDKKVAIACQGGGSHTAFTAGVLKRLLKESDGYEIVP
jgi:NTE family protein